MHIAIAPSPLQLIDDAWLREMDVQLYLKRDDLLHPTVQGNKWRKLKYNLLHTQELGNDTLLTFGGPYSNHIYATAAAAKLFGFKSIGIIRGEEPKDKSYTLKFAASQGMQLLYVDRTTYRSKDDDNYLQQLQQQYPDAYIVPEGGTNQYALRGVAELVREIEEPFDYLCSACGTGGTLAGMVAGLRGEKQLIGFSSLKGGDALTGEIDKLVQEYAGQSYHNYTVNFDYHFGGYAKVRPELLDFIKAFKAQHGIQLEPVYTGKLLFGIYDLIKQGYFSKGSAIVAVHTGGLQGLSGYLDWFPELRGEFGL
jgi:1-aminocyclopropane-1-carboxylate deaminase/D-cysteine desulfhydrase-like pyridoxal-dependent ACC family enzyme